MPAFRSIATLLVALGLLVTARVEAITPFVPLEDHRVIHVSADYFGDHEFNDTQPSTPFGDFLVPDFRVIASSDEQGGDCVARAAQLSRVIPSIGYMAFEGGADGGWNGLAGGTWSAVSLARIKFRLLTCKRGQRDRGAEPPRTPRAGHRDRVEPGSGATPRAFTVSPAAPNPFASATSFRYESTSPAHVTMAIYNVAGARVKLLVDELVPGLRTVTWDGKTTSGVRAPAGIYYLLVDAGGLRETRKVALLR